MKERLDIARLCFAKTLILGHKPEFATLAKVNEAIAKDPHLDMASFGLFETSAPNYTTYYPEVTAEDLKPKEGEFIYPVVRALSQVIVHKNRNPIDFGVNDSLRQSMKLLLGQTVNADHEMALGNAMGAIKEVEWQDSYKVENMVVPAGINATLAIDGKSNPRIARLMQMDPPGIHSVSVTVEFAWEKSHPEIADEAFWSKLGGYDEKGNMYKRNVTKVKRFHEISLVAHGADPYAQLLGKDGKIVNPKYAHISYNSAQEKKVGAQYYMFDMGTDLVKNSTILGDDIIINDNDNQTSQTSGMKEMILLLSALAAAAGIEGVNLTAELTEIPADTANALKAGITKLKTTADKANDLATQLSTLQSAGDAVALKQFQDKVTESLRTTVENQYKLVTPTPAQPILDSIKNANYDALIVMQDTYTTQLEEKMPLTCTKCNSTEVSRASATANDLGGNHKPNDHVELSQEDTMKALRLSGLSSVANKLHGVEETASAK